MIAREITPPPPGTGEPTEGDVPGTERALFVEALPYKGHGGGLWHYNVRYKRFRRHVVVYDDGKTYAYVASLVRITPE